MNAESFLIPKEDATRQWLQTSELFFNDEDEHPVIDFNRGIEFSSRFKNNADVIFISQSFNEVDRIALTKNTRFKSGPTKTIVIDIPLSIAELESFSSFIKKKTNAILIYNKSRLTKHEAKFLKAFELVDEVTDLEKNNIDYIVKNTIKRKFKNSQKKLYNSTKKLHVKGKEKAKECSFCLKKIFDITTAAIIIFCLLPVFILIAIAIRLDSKGPVFYSSKRAGRGYKIFKFYKFRSMVNDADKKIKELAHLNQYNVDNGGPVFFKLDNDPRVTRVGKFLRNTSLDELPQLFNILLGDMSLVGNRPLPLYEAATLTTNEFVERFSAPAGMTGFWQIKKRGKAEMSVRERVDLDITYARRASPLFDLYIIANTPAALFQKSSV